MCGVSFSYKSFRSVPEGGRAVRSLQAAAIFVLFAGCGEAVFGENREDTMNYRVIEHYYGPEIRFHDWQPARGDFVTDQREIRRRWPDELRGEGQALILAGGALQVFAKEPSLVTRSDYPYGGGGDVELCARFHFERMGDDGSVAFHFNDDANGGGKAGFRVVFEPGRITAFLRGEEIYSGAFDRFQREVQHLLKLVTLADRYAILLNGRLLAEGEMDTTRGDNEGWTHLAVEDAAIELTGFEENFIEHDVEFPDWERTEQLYRESFGPESYEENWVLNGEAPEVAEDFFIVRNMGNLILRERFEGPVAVDIEASQVTMEDEYSAGVTDAIFIWMMDKADGDLFEYLKSLDNASLRNLMEIPFYWVDFGGSNNVTTRFRKNPHRWMIRQFQDRPRLLERDRIYQITLVQNGNLTEFWVDGDPWIRAYDPDPLRSGHIAFRAFIGDLKVESLEVWRIE